MYKKFALLFLILISSVSISTALGEDVAGQKVTIKTDNTAYEQGDIITVTGNVEKILPGTPMILQIFFDKTQVDVAQIEISNQGDFSTTFVAEGPLWKSDGIVIIRASYGSTSSETDFNFFSEITEDLFLLNAEVEIPNEGTFDVPYTMKGGTVQSVSLNQQNLGINLKINTTSDGFITIKLLRDYIDSMKNDGTDENFIIVIHDSQGNDPLQTEYKEIDSTNESRTIQIPLERGDNEIEIIGTHVVPEFGTIAALILVVAIASIIAITAKSRVSLMPKL